MRKFIVPLLFLITHISVSQSYLGYNTDNYSGLHGVVYNPGAIADSRVKTEINIVSASSIIATDYTYLTLSNISSILGDDGFNGLDRFPSDQNEILVNVDVLGPSFMFSLNEKSSIGLITRIRLVSNFNNVNGELFEGIYDGFPVDDFNFQQENLDFTTHAWGEVGLAYGRVLVNKPNSILKTGVTLKYVVGGGALQGSSNSLSGNFNTNTNQVALQGDFAYAISYSDDQEATDYFSEISPGFGADVGFVYEYRSNKSLAASNNNNPRGFNQYKLKVGLSILDIGSINYNGSEVTNYTVNTDVNAQALEDDFIEALDNSTTQNTTNESIKVSLPTSIHLNIDYNLYKKFYLNLDINNGLVSKDAFFNNNRLNLITLTPRYESRVFGAYLPISTSSLGKTTLGAGIRFGPLFFGSGTLFSNLSEKSNAANFFAGLKIPLYHKRKM